MDQNHDLEKASRLLTDATAISVLTGAGVSAESGVPTFRGEDGLWRRYRAEELATPQAFARDPKLVWEWYDWRRGLIADCRPNPAHLALVEIENRAAAAGGSFHLLTQNVDGLHRLAGSNNLSELHGCLWRVRCLECSGRFEDRRVPIPIVPACEDCGGMLRPDVVWFGESLDSGVLTRAVEAARKCDLMLVVGTSAVVQPAASLAEQAKRAGAAVIEINLEPTPYTGRLDVSLLGRAGEILPALIDR
jgi:NAD-dependent deacetylase